MAKNEAKIKFSAETGDFNDAIKKSNNEMGKLRAEMKLNETQMKNTGASVEGLEKKHDLLEQQLKASQDKTEALNGKVEAATRIFGENSDEVTKLKTQLANAQTAEERLKGALADCNRELQEHKDSSNDSESATEQLTNKIEDQQTELNKLKDEYVDAVLQYGKNSDEAKELSKQIDSLSDELHDNKLKLNNAEEAANEFDNSLDNAGESAEGFNGKMAAVAAGVVAAGAALVEFGKSSIEAFNEVDEGADNVIKATGATGDVAESLENSYKKVASSIVGDFSDIGSALGEVNTRFGYTGEELETASVKFQKFSEITGVDATDAVQFVSRALNDAGIPLEEYDSLLDQLAKAGQAAGVDVATLADSLSTNGAIMRSMGFDTEETIALLANFELAGADTSTMLTGMKKAMSNWADEGKNGNVEFAKMVKGIQNGSISASDAIDVFGTKAGPMLVDAIKSGKFEYQDMLAVIQDSKGTVESTFDGTVDGGYELELAMQNCKMALAEVGGVVGETLTPVFQALSETVIPAVVDGFGAVVEGIQGAVQWMKEHKAVVIAVASVIGVLTTAITAYNIVQGVKAAMDAANVTTVWALVAAHWAQATAAMAAIAPYILIVAAIAAVIAIIVLCVKYWDEIVAAVKVAVEAVKKALTAAWKWMKKTFSTICDWIKTKVIEPVKNFFVNLWTSVSDGAKQAVQWIKNTWNTITTWIDMNIIQPVVNFFKGLWQSIVNIWNTICNAIQVAIMFIGSILSAAFQIITLPFMFIWENCKQYVFAAWEWIKNAVSTAINAVSNVITTVMNAISTFFSTIWNAIKDFFIGVWNDILAFVTPIIESIKTVISNAWNAISTTVTTVLNSVKNTVTNVWNAIKTAVTTAVNAIKTSVSNIWNGIKTAVLVAVNSIKTTITNVFNAIKTTVSNIWNGIKSVISLAWENIKTSVSQKINAVKTTISNVFNALKTTVTNVWNSIKNAITTPIETAKEAVRNAIDAIKGFFDFEWSFPHLKMPHFTITGSFSLDPPSVPHLSVEWYKQGGVMLNPTIFGLNGNRAMVGGEAGPEAIAPISVLQSYISDAVERTMQAFNLQALAAAVEDLANRPIELYVGDRQIALATASANDSVNGLRSTFKSRGLIVD